LDRQERSTEPGSAPQPRAALSLWAPGGCHHWRAFASSLDDKAALHSLRAQRGAATMASTAVFISWRRVPRPNLHL
jgi:hypothetical protein